MKIKLDDAEAFEIDNGNIVNELDDDYEQIEWLIWSGFYERNEDE